MGEGRFMTKAGITDALGINMPVPEEAADRMFAEFKGGRNRQT
jgi:hypothetical protein